MERPDQIMTDSRSQPAKVSRADAASHEAATNPDLLVAIRNLGSGKRSEESFEKIFKGYYPRICRFFAGRFSSPQECEELTQDVFLRVYKGRGTFDSQAEFEGWLIKIAGNVYRNALRRREAGKRRGQEHPLELLEELALLREPDTDNPLAATLDREKLRLLAQAMSSLPHRMRRCAILRFYHDYTYKEISVVLGVSIETVKAHLYQARHRLKEALAPHFGGLDDDDGAP